MTETPLFESKIKIDASFVAALIVTAWFFFLSFLLITQKNAAAFLILALAGGMLYGIFRDLKMRYKVFICDNYLWLNERQIFFEEIHEIRLYDYSKPYSFWKNIQAGKNTTAILLKSSNAQQSERLEIYTEKYSNGVELAAYLEQIEQNRRKRVYFLQNFHPQKQNNFVNYKELPLLDIKKTYNGNLFKNFSFYLHLTALIGTLLALFNCSTLICSITMTFFLLANWVLAIYNSYYFELSTHHLIIRNNLLWTYKKVIPFKQIRRVTIHKIHRTEEYVLEILFKNHERCKYNAIYIPKGKLDDLAATLNKK
ncbi:MAG: hypothetical protein JNM36_14270 [Chitinophagales bacterium]|nr:hypothetical protein [Chitinophagales bacterium]